MAIAGPTRKIMTFKSVRKAPITEGHLEGTIAPAEKPTLSSGQRPQECGSRTRIRAKLIRAHARSYVLAHLHDPELGIAQISEALGYSKRYLHKCFSRGGQTVMDYIWSERLERCRRALLRPSEVRGSVTEIAFSCGFNSSSHFSHRFKERFGVSPSRVRRRLEKCRTGANTDGTIAAATTSRHL